MSRIPLLLLAVLALVGAGLWYALASEAPRGAHPETAAVESPTLATAGGPLVESAPLAESVPSPQSAPPAEGADGAEPALDAGRQAAREPAASAKEAELAGATWVEGRVILPPGTPADEELTVVAKAQGSAEADFRARVARDGTFRVAFPTGRARGRLELVGRYLYLPGDALWERKVAGPVVLEPGLGARLVGRLRLPPGTETGPKPGEVVLRSVKRSGIDSRGRCPLTDRLEFAFDALAPGDGRTYTLELDSARFVARLEALAPAAGSVLEVELEAVPGVCLTGVVRDENGTPLEARLHAEARADTNRRALDFNEPSLERIRSGASDPDGAFLLGALGAGTVRLTATCDGFVPLERDLGRLEPGEALDLELVLSRGRSLAGSVRWPDGSPAKATLALIPVGGDPQSPLVGASDDKGAFRISGLAPTAYRVTARATRTETVRAPSAFTGKERDKSKRSEWNAALESVEAGRSDLVLTLASALTVSGRVVDDRGLPLERFSLSARPRPAGSVPSGWSDGRSATFRDGDGRFALDGLAPGEWDLVASSPERADSEPVPVTLPRSEPVVLVVPRGARLSGLVLGPSGAPAAHASIELDEKTFGHSLHADETDASGRFALAGLHAGALTLQARSEGFASSSVQVFEVENGESRGDLVLRLRAAGTVLGLLVDAEGRPRTGEVWAFGEEFGTRVESDSEGRFELHEVPPGELLLRVHTADGLAFEERLLLAEGETARIRLAPPGATVRLFGHVRAGGEPLGDVGLLASRMDGPRPGGGPSTSSSSRADAEGAYELSLPGPGRYELGIQGNGESSFGWQVPLEVPALAAFEFDPTIPLGRISGRVTDSRGAALAGIRVLSEPEQHEGGPHGFARALTDAEGRFELLVPAGRHAVVAASRESVRRGDEASRYTEARTGGLVVQAGDHLRGIELVLTEGGSLAGLARRADGSGARVELWSEDATGVHRLGRSDPSGRFELTGLDPGRLLVGARGATLATLTTVPVEIVTGETARLELTLVPARPVHLRIREHGLPVGSELSLRDAQGRRLPIDTRENGEAWAGPLVPGRYTVRAERDVQHVERTFELTEGPDELVLELVFE